VTNAETSAPPAARRPRPRAGAQGGQAAPPTGTAAAPQRDWKNPDDYGFTEGLDPLGWAWQFLRRNTAYKRQCESYISEVVARGEHLPWFGPYFYSSGELEGRVVLSDVGRLPILDTRTELPDSQIIRLAFQGWLGDPRHLPEFEDYNPLTWIQRPEAERPGEADRGWRRRAHVGLFRVFLELELAPQFAWIQEHVRNLQVAYVRAGLRVRRLKWGIHESENRDRFKCYLRALDGADSREEVRHIGKVLFSEILEGIPREPARPARPGSARAAREKHEATRRAEAGRNVYDRARAALRAGRRLTREPWVILLSNPPRRPAGGREDST
jgi:transcriptional regulator